ncbi:MAG: hypothetical protein Q8P95_03230 [bacterium]|nr:hypothetical protein [bacterium]
MNASTWFWRSLGIIMVIMMTVGVVRVGSDWLSEFFPATLVPASIDLQQNPLQQAFYPDVNDMGLGAMTVYRDHDDAAAYQNLRANSGFAARSRVGAGAAMPQALHPVKSAAVRNTSSGEVLRYAISADVQKILGTFYLGTVQALNVPQSFVAYQEARPDFAIYDISANDDGEVYVVFQANNQTYLQQFRVDYSTGLLISTGVQQNLPNSPEPGRTVFQSNSLYFADVNDLYQVTLAGNGFNFASTGVGQFSVDIQNIQLVQPGNKNNYVMIVGDSGQGRARIYVVEQNRSVLPNTFTLLSLGGASAFVEPDVNSADWNDVSLAIRTVPDQQVPVLAYVGPSNNVCIAQLLPQFGQSGCNGNKLPVVWIDSSQSSSEDGGSVLYQTAGQVTMASQVAGQGVPTALSNPSGVWYAGAFPHFERWFGVTNALVPVWHQRTLMLGGNLTTNPLFQGLPYGQVLVEGNVIGKNPLSFTLDWSVNDLGFGSVLSQQVQLPDPAQADPTAFSVLLSGLHLDAQLRNQGDRFRFNFGQEQVLVSNLRITAMINQDATFTFANCYQQLANGNTPVSFSIADPEGDFDPNFAIQLGLQTLTVGASQHPPAVILGAQNCQGNVCTATVPGLPVGNYPGTFDVVFTDVRGNTSQDSSAVGVVISPSSTACGAVAPGGGRGPQGAAGTQSSTNSGRPVRPQVPLPGSASSGQTTSVANTGSPSGPGAGTGQVPGSGAGASTHGAAPSVPGSSGASGTATGGSRSTGGVGQTGDSSGLPFDQFPPLKLYFTEVSDGLISVFTTLQPYQGNTQRDVDPSGITVHLVTNYQQGQVALSSGRVNEFPYLKALMPKGGVAELVYSYRGQEYHREYLNTLEPMREAIVRAVGEVTPLVQSIRQLRRDRLSDSARVSAALDVILPGVLTNASKTVHGAAVGDSVKFCLIDLSSGEVLEGNQLEISAQGSYYGSIANQDLASGEYASLAFVDQSKPCLRLVESWFVFEKRDPFPVTFIVSEPRLNIGSLQFNWLSTDKTLMNDSSGVALDLGGDGELSVRLQVLSPFSEDTDLVLHFLEDFQSFSLQLPAGAEAVLPITIPLAYGEHRLLLEVLTDAGVKMLPDVLLSLDYQPVQAAASHGSANEPWRQWMSLIALGLTFVMGFTYLLLKWALHRRALALIRRSQNDFL